LGVITGGCGILGLASQSLVCCFICTSGSCFIKVRHQSCCVFASTQVIQV
jgi:hypothetical protein